MGYTNVTDYKGGKADWSDSGNRLEAGDPAGQTAGPEQARR
jgi:hypothetical protein